LTTLTLRDTVKPVTKKTLAIDYLTVYCWLIKYK